MSRRMLFVRLPNFSTELFLKTQQANRPSQRPWWEKPNEEATIETSQDIPLVLVEHGAKGTRISAPSPQAMALGLWPDMKLADARTMVPVIRVETHDKSADAAAQNRLAQWMMRWSPAVSPYGCDGFLLDTTGCDHLFGGERGMAADIINRLATFGFTARLAFADTVAAAIAIVDHVANEVTILPVKAAENALDSLPVEALRLDGNSIILLKRLGLKLIGDVRPIPRAALERRFRERAKSKTAHHAHTAKSVQMRLDQLCGHLAEPLAFITQPSPFRTMRQCPQLALEQGAVEIALDGLLSEICQMLEAQSQGARLFRLTAYRADGGTSSAQVRLSIPARNAAMIHRLFRDRLEQIDCGFGIDLFTLDAMNCERVNGAQNEMEGAAEDKMKTAALAAFADIVSNRVGHIAALRFEPRASHVPERAQRAVPVSTRSHENRWHHIVQAPRPLRLLERPEPANVTAELPDSPPMQFVWRKVLRKIIRSRGPERILPEWWRDDLKTKSSATFRDYYDVEDAQGLRYWLFRSIRDVPLADPDPYAPAKEPAHGWDHGGRLQNPTIETAPVKEVETVRTIQWFVHGLF